jgi:hypothetical protein
MAQVQEICRVDMHEARNFQLAHRIMCGVERDQFSEYLRGSNSAKCAVAVISSLLFLVALDVLVWGVR